MSSFFAKFDGSLPLIPSLFPLVISLSSSDTTCKRALVPYCLVKRAVEVPSAMYVKRQKVNLQQQGQSAAKDGQYEFFQSRASSLAMIHNHSQVLAYNFSLCFC